MHRVVPWIGILAISGLLLPVMPPTIYARCEMTVTNKLLPMKESVKHWGEFREKSSQVVPVIQCRAPTSCCPEGLGRLTPPLPDHERLSPSIAGCPQKAAQGTVSQDACREEAHARRVEGAGLADGRVVGMVMRSAGRLARGEGALYGQAAGCSGARGWSTPCASVTRTGASYQQPG